MKMLVNSRRWDVSLGQFIAVQNEVDTSMKSIVATYADLLVIDKKIGDMRIVLDTKQLYVWDGQLWQTQGTFDVTEIMLFSTIQTIS
jgi:hypothetical protein